MTITIDEARCKYCDSHNVIRYGHFKHIQRWWCKDCERKFADNGAQPGQRTPTEQVTSALGMYCEGMSLNAIRRVLNQEHNNFPSDSTVHEWVDKHTKTAIAKAKDYYPKVGDTWIADWTYVRVDRHRPGEKAVANPYVSEKKAKWIVFWDIIPVSALTPVFRPDCSLMNCDITP